MAVDVVTEAVIHAPVAEVAELASDPASAPAWYDNIESVELLTEPPLRVGSRARFRARFMGRSLEYTYVVSELRAGERLVMRTADGPFPMETTYTWDAAGASSTTMRLRNRGEPTGFSRLLAPLMAPAMRRANRKDLRRLKAILEGP